MQVATLYFFLSADKGKKAILGKILLRCDIDTGNEPFAAYGKGVGLNITLDRSWGDRVK